jgi:hypothetical protein
MMHPLAEDFSELKDAEIETRVSELSKKYWQSNNPSIQNQIALFLDLYNEELKSRRAKLWQQQYQNRDKGLDKLINVK